MARTPTGSAASKGERLRAAARALQWKFSKTRDVWYGDERVSLKPGELRTIEEVSGVAYARKEVDELDQVVSRADALLQGAAPDFHSALAGAIREALRAVVRARIEGRRTMIEIARFWLVCRVAAEKLKGRLEAPGIACSVQEPPVALT